MDKIKHVPTIIIQGRYDLICPPQNAYDLYQQLLNAELWILSHAGHSSRELAIGQAMVSAMDRMKK